MHAAAANPLSGCRPKFLRQPALRCRPPPLRCCRAVQLRPHDARMWNAMGHCYQQEQLGLLDAAIRCHRRALPYDKEGVAVHELVRGGGVPSP